MVGTTNAATVVGDGVKVTQKTVDARWLDLCNRACQLDEKPHVVEGVDVLLRSDDIDADRPQVYRKEGLGMTNDITIRVDLPSFCGHGTHWESKAKRCLVDKVPTSLCGLGTRWDDTLGQCVRRVSCTSGFRLSGDMCVPATSVAPAAAAPKTAFFELNTPVVAGNGVEIEQQLTSRWLDTCFPVCELPKPQTLRNVTRTLDADDIDGVRGQVYREEGLGFTENIVVNLNSPSFCGPGVHWNVRLKRCVPNRVPSTFCGEDTVWDALRGQCVRKTGCESGSSFAGDVCVHASPAEERIEGEGAAAPSNHVDP